MEIKINTLGEAVKFKRCLAGMTQRKLASLLGVDYTYISKIENDRVIPSIETIEKIEEILDFQPGELPSLAGFVSEEVMFLIKEILTQKGETTLVSLLSNFLK
ncbi:MAG: helix-turn-helix transcriptional regulator [Oscillatoriaceae cyanobacterium Prado104]|jgi:transcriptional regulator with XRE-family HTH domain|nr:helix-turn-helix transcriptional regulator [Oscillatoriaceae cyanobacterium Prado104]